MYYDFEEDNKNSRKIIREVIIWGVEIAAVILLAFLTIYFAFEKTNMVGSSMEKTLNNEDPILINKFSYHVSKPKRFDIIVFKQSGKEHSYYNIKRIIGLPGETLQIKEGEIYKNGKILEETFNVDEMMNYGLAEEKIKLEANEYFVLGDNRNDSEDSRFVSIGNISRKEIVGKAFLRLKPFDLISKLNLKEEKKVE